MSSFRTTWTNVKANSMVTIEMKTDSLDTPQATISDLEATDATIDNLVCTDASVTNLTATNATVSNPLSISDLTVTDLQATNAQVDSLTVNNQIALPAVTLPTSGGTAAVLSDYEIFTMPVTLTGPFPDEPNSITIVRFGKICYLKIDPFEFVQNAAARIVLTPAIPARFRPQDSAVTGGFTVMIVPVIDNGIEQAGNISIQQDGMININTGYVDSQQFSGTGTAGILNPCTVPYMLP